jgi:N-acyl-D-aspartate/D-glutamate deacylase
VLWDGLCTWTCYHGTTTVVNGNCSLGLAPARPGERDALVSMLSRVEAIPIESLNAGIDGNWETVAEYLDLLDQRAGINVGALIGFSAVRRYVMEDAAYSEQATPEQLERMKALIREGIAAGSIGLSFERNPTHFDIEGRLLPCNAANNGELIAAASALGEVGAGSIQFGGNERNGVTVELLAQVAQASGRPVICGLGIEPSRERLDGYERARAQGARLIPMMPPFLEDPARWTLHSVNQFDVFPTWRPIIASPAAEKHRAFGDPAVREKLRAEAKDYRWGATAVSSVGLAKNQHLVGKSLAAMAQEQGKEPLDAFLDLAMEEDFATIFMRDTGADPTEKGAFLADPRVMPGLSDGGAHVTRRCDSHFSTYMFAYWVREQQALSLEEAVQKLTFLPATAFGLHDRGMIRPGLAADLTVFDPDTVATGEVEPVKDFPGGATRMRRLPQGVDCTIVNGQVLIEDGEHTGALPGRVVRSSAYHAQA